MKTLTEFAAASLKNAHKSKQELTAAGKTAEELPAALGEALKIEGDKLTFIQNALELVGEKFEDLKRVIVFSLNEGEKAPHGAIQKGEQYYSAEYYPSMNPQKKGRGEHPGGRDGKGRGGKGGDKKGKRGRGSRGGGRREGGAGGPGGERGAGPGGPGAGGERGPRGPRRDNRGPGAGAPAAGGGQGPRPKITPKAQPAPTGAPAAEQEQKKDSE